MSPSPWTSCGHIRQAFLPCATPKCSLGVQVDEIKHETVTLKGVKAGIRHSLMPPPLEYRTTLVWKRGMAVPPAGPTGERDVQFVWVPETGLSRGCFDTSLAVQCPNCRTYLGSFKFYRSGLSFLVGCPGCKKKLLPRYLKTGFVEWYEHGGSFLGTTHSTNVWEYKT